MANDIERVVSHPVDAAGLRVIRDWALDLVAGDLKVVEKPNLPAEPQDDTLYVVTEVVDDEEVVTYHLCTNGTLRQVETGGAEDYDELDNRPGVDGTTLTGDKSHEELGLVGVADFVTEPTGKSEGIEIVIPAASPSNPIRLSEIDDSEDMEYSTVHTSSNSKINSRFVALENSVSGKLNYRFVDELPEELEFNTQYYVTTDDPTVFDITLVDSVGDPHDLGSTAVDVSGFVNDTRTIAGLALSADITAQQVQDATKTLTASLENKTIDAEKNTVRNLEVTSMKSGVVQTSMPTSPTDYQFITAHGVKEYGDTKQDKLTAQAVAEVGASTKLSGIDLDNKKSMDVTAEALSKYVADKFFPVGSIYVTTTKTNPSETLGVGTWSIVAEDRVLWGISNDTTAGTTLDEQLPNVKGDLDFSSGAQGHPEITASGAFKATNATGAYPAPTGSSGGGRKINLNASRSSSTYTDNGIVRPKAYTVHIWQRTA